MYIPKDATEITFTNIKSGSTVKYTAQQQSDAFFAYIEQDDYLKKHKGEYAERNGALMPWINRFDVKILQDVKIEAGGMKHTLQFSCDILNAGNLLNPDWGIYQRQTRITSYNVCYTKLLRVKNRIQNKCKKKITQGFSPKH